MLSLLKKLGRTDGAEIAEVALVLPLVFMFLLGIVWFGRAFSIYATITQAAEQGAIVAARPTCATCGNSFTNSDVNNAVNAVMNAARLDTSQMQPNASGAPTFCQSPPAPPGQCSPVVPPNQITICRAVVLNSPVAANSTPQCGVTVSFTYPFRFFLPFTSLNMQQVNLTAHAESRMEN